VTELTKLISERSLPSAHTLFAAMRAKYFEARETAAAADHTEDPRLSDDLWRNLDRQIDELLELLWALEVGGHQAAIAEHLAAQEGRA
jgi:hypothetical protein